MVMMVRLAGYKLMDLYTDYNLDHPDYPNLPPPPNPVKLRNFYNALIAEVIEQMNAENSPDPQAVQKRKEKPRQ